MLGVESQGRVGGRRGSRLGPVGWLLVVMVVGYALVLAVFGLIMYGASFGDLFVVLLLAYDFLIYFIYFWIGVYLLVEAQLWRRTRNPGHLLQFLGALLVLAPISWGLVLSATGSLPGNPYAMFSLAGVALLLLEFLSFVTGAGMAVYGYYHRPFHASDVDLYRNVVVRAGEKIGLLTDGYSTRVYETRYEGFPTDAVRAQADEYASRFQRAGFFLFHRTDASGITVFPITYTGVGGLRIATAFAHLYRLWRRPERLTWVRVEWTGDVKVHISPEDYARIKRPVAHHVLCAGVADAVVGSLLAYASGRPVDAVRGLLGPESVHRAADARLPPSKATGSEWATVAVALAIFFAGMGAAVTLDVMSVPGPTLSFTGIYWEPVHPVGGQPITLFANLTGLDPFSGPLNTFRVSIWAYYNDSLFGARDMANIEGNRYGVQLGSYPNGTELTFMLGAYSYGGGRDTIAYSSPYVLDVGTVRQAAAGQLSIAAPTAHLDFTGTGSFGAWINSTAPLETVLVLFDGYYTYSGSQGSGSGGEGPAAWNLSASGNYYHVAIPLNPVDVAAGSRLHLVLWYKFVARDTSWNTATTPMLTYEVNT